jgi:hypothetical protein
MRLRAILRAILLATLPCGWIPAAIAQAAAAAKPPPCSAPEHRQFDFWLGDWEVREPSGKSAGRNRIVAIHGGCALQESWTGAGGTTGSSLNAYDDDRKAWHQTWVDSGGGVLKLDGGLVDGRMVLSGEALTSDDPPKASRQRITWTPLPDGRVRQLWESSTDSGKTWSIVFDGVYSRR